MINTTNNNNYWKIGTPWELPQREFTPKSTSDKNLKLYTYPSGSIPRVSLDPKVSKCAWKIITATRQKKSLSLTHSVNERNKINTLPGGINRAQSAIFTATGGKRSVSEENLRAYIRVTTFITFHRTSFTNATVHEIINEQESGKQIYDKHGKIFDMYSL